MHFRDQSDAQREWPCSKSDVNICAKVSAVLFQLPRKLGDCGENAHTVDVNICRTPSTTKFYNEHSKKRFRGGEWETKPLLSIERAKEAHPAHALIFFRARLLFAAFTFSRHSQELARFNRNHDGRWLKRVSWKSCGRIWFAVIMRLLV